LSEYRELVFTGIVRERGRVDAVERRGSTTRLRVSAPETAAGTRVGDSVAVSGVCLTAVDVSNGSVAFDVVEESLRRSSLGRLAEGAGVNVEPALRAGEPLGGHIVQGHVDGVGRVRAIDDEGVEIEAGADVLRYCVEKGSIAVDGVSLTIAALAEDGFRVALVPHTRDVTTLGEVEPGDEVNLEIDMVAKYVERLAGG
jgi:riboflavin synthase